jgi:hypothetical protein
MKPFALALTLAALSPAAASAASWSAPVDVIPSPASAPTALVSGATGRSLVLAGSGNEALLASGTVAGVFGSPLPVASGTSAVGTDSALGADGTVAIAWATAGTGHLTVVKPGGDVLTNVALPGAGVNSIGVAIASDGAVVVAYRTKESANSYSLRVATMPAATMSIGEPVTLQSGPAADAIDVAAGPGGALAIAFRQLGGKYRARVAVKPAGASAFEPGAAMSRAAGEGDDYAPHAVFDADGTVVAAWGNAGGALYALRAPGAGTSFGPATALGAGPAYDVDLAPAAGGAGAAVGIAGGGVMRVASQGAPGAGFSEPVTVGPTFTSQFGGDIAVTETPAGTVTALWANPNDGAVHAVDADGSDVVVGYGARDALTPVSIASSGDRTLAAWSNAGGTVVAATRSATVRAATPGDLGPAPAGRDTAPPKLTLVGLSKRVSVTTKTKTVVLKARCSEACRLFATSNLRTKLSGKARQRVAPLPAVQTKTPRTGVQKVTLKLGTLALKDLRAALKKHRGGQLFVVIQAADASSNLTRIRVQTTLKPRAAKKHK